MTYLVTDTKIATRLVVAVFSLRRYYDGPVVVYSMRKHNDDLLKAICSERRLGITLQHLHERDWGLIPRSAYNTKVDLACSVSCDVTLFLDADTVIMDTLGELIQQAKDYSLVVTAFANQTTDGKFARVRWPIWRSDILDSGYAGSWLPLVDQIISSSDPLINTGVMAFHRRNPILAEWQKLADLGKHSYAPDEDALQLLLPNYPHRLLSDQFNCIPEVREIADYHTNVANAKILHFAACSHLDYPFGQKYWMPVFEECCRLRIADIHLWNNVEEELKARSPRRLRPRR